MAEDQNRTLQDKFMLRFPDGMRDRMRDEAEKNGRSMNAEIVARLQQSLEAGDAIEINYFKDIVDRLFEDNSRLRQTLDELAKQIQTLRKTDDEKLRDAFESEKRRMQGALTRYVDMDVNSYHDVSEFVGADRDGRNTKSRLATPDELANLNLPEGTLVLVLGAKDRPATGQGDDDSDK